jgi:ankyrin repeat protein
MRRYTLETIYLLALAAGAASAQESAAQKRASAEEVFQTIRSDDMSTLRQLVSSGAANVKDKLSMSALHYAALYGSSEAVRILLEGGADPNVTNGAGSTPLIFGAYNLEKTKLLVAKGADVNAANDLGTRPLWVATSTHGNGAAVRHLIEHGADPSAVSRNATDFLQRAAMFSEPEVVRLLLDKGVDGKRSNSAGVTALSLAFSCDEDGRVKMLLDAGSDVNAANRSAGRVKNGPIALTQITPLMRAASSANASGVVELLATGAKVNDVDVRRMTALMLAVANDRPNLEAIRALIAAGADLTIKDVYGDTALDWARKFGPGPAVTLLEKAGAKGHEIAAAPARASDYHPNVTEAIQRSSALLAASSQTFFTEGGGCVGCHHQPMAGRAFAALRAGGLQPDPRLRQVLMDGLIAERPLALTRLPQLIAGNGDIDGMLFWTVAMAELGEPASSMTDAIVHFVASRQNPSGSWDIAQGGRPPMEDTPFTRTMMAVWTLKAYGWPARRAEFEERLTRARKWLLAAEPHTTQEECDRLIALWLTGSSEKELRGMAQALLKRQRADGGWAQTSQLEPDAYGTSLALYSLGKAGVLKASDDPYSKGVAYLLRTQYPDGSWFVRSRAPKLQPYFQSGFPYNHEQWISASATAYAMMALAPIMAKP